VEFEAQLGCSSRHFARPEERRRVRFKVRGMLSPVARRNSWQVAE
jgi:hypothetical protein